MSSNTMSIRGRAAVAAAVIIAVVAATCLRNRLTAPIEGEGGPAQASAMGKSPKPDKA